jgi:hypothetical protein
LRLRAAARVRGRRSIRFRRPFPLSTGISFRCSRTIATAIPSQTRTSTTFTAANWLTVNARLAPMNTTPAWSRSPARQKNDSIACLALLRLAARRQEQRMARRLLNRVVGAVFENLAMRTMAKIGSTVIIP